jgi:putative endonuclease
MYFVYCILCRNDSIYTGITDDVARRFREHQSGKGGKYTRAFGAVKVLYTERAANRSAALKREAAIKRLSSRDKMQYIRKQRV